MLGKIKVKGISLGGAGALFVGILFGHLGLRVEGNVLHFIQEFGLILFVYTIGMQVGPGFMDSIRRHGLVLNILSTGVVLLGIVVTLCLYFFTDMHNTYPCSSVCFAALLQTHLLWVPRILPLPRPGWTRR
jgi:Predicted permease